MNDTPINRGPVAAVIGLVGLLVAGAVAVFGPRTSELPKKVDTFFERTNAQLPQERHADVAAQIGELQSFADDPDFAQLPKPKQQDVTGRLTELKAYQAYAEAVNSIASPATADSEAKLKAIENQVARIKVPAEYSVEWSQTDAGERHRRLQDDTRALGHVVADTERGYRKAADEAELLRTTSEAANLPGRARKIVAEADALPSPVADRDKPIPGSKEITYSSVFKFEDVNAAYQRWEQARPLLKRIASLGGKE
jgi:hypothetical protein